MDTMAEAEAHPLSDAQDTTVHVELVKKPSTATSTKITKPPERTGICQSCEWFKDSPRDRWQFCIFWLFPILCILWILIRYFGSSLTADIVAGIFAIILAVFGATHFRTLLHLKVEVEKFGTLNQEFKKENIVLRMEVSRLSKAGDELSAIKDRLQETTRNFEANIRKFRKVDETLSKLSESNIEGIEKLQKMSKRVQESVHNDLVQHERDILHKVMDALEFKDSKEGLDEDEYNQFIKMLPLSFQRRFSHMDKSFTEIAGSDRILDFHDFKKLADDFAIQEAKSGGSHNS